MILRFPGRPPTHNEMRRRVWAGAKLSQTWRQAAAATAAGRVRAGEAFPAETRVTIDVYQLCRRRPMPDPGAMYDVAKAVIDGLEDAQLIAGDGPAHVAWVRFHAPVKHDRDELILELLTEEVAT